MRKKKPHLVIKGYAWGRKVKCSSLRRRKRKKQAQPSVTRLKRRCRNLQNPFSFRPIFPLLPCPSHARLAPNNPKLTAQSFSPITGVESDTISQLRSGKGVSFRSTFGGRAGPPLPCTGGWRRARARCCCVCAGRALEARARFGVVDDADALDELRRERTLGSVSGI